MFGEHLGRIDLEGEELRASLVPVTEDVPCSLEVLAAAEREQQQLDASLDEVIAELDQPLDARWIAGVVRQRMDADVGLATSGAAIDRPLPPGPLRRGDLWEVCHSTGNPGVVSMTGAQLAQVIERGSDPAFQRTTAGPLRGRERGPLHVVGPSDLDPTSEYLVAGTDWELEPYGGMVDAAWQLRARYDFPIILREAIEEHLRS
jgi:2',3'-cyclic-nucleotide 2'-phosphodiesterase (5'-nucleotidase family)